MPVAVIIRSRNSDWVIDQALLAIDSQRFRDYRIYVTDCSSTDRTQAMIGYFSTTLSVIDAESYFPGEVLNEAIACCDEEIIVFINSDAVLLTPGSLGRIVAAFDDPTVMAAVGRQLPRPGAQAWVRREYCQSFPDADVIPPWIGLSLPLAAIRRSAWLQHHFYTQAWASEDTEWGQWAKAEGWQIKYVAAAVAMHSHNYSLRQLYGRKFVEGEADLFIYQGVRVSLYMTCRRTLARMMKESWYCLRVFAWWELVLTPVRATVYHWAYYRGQRLAERRQQGLGIDATKGQREVLKRYDR